MIPELETCRPSYLFDFTYPELLTCKEPVVDEHGGLWAGRDRKTEMQSEAYRKSLWGAWQQSFKTRHEIAQDAMDYFQMTKHLSRPPQEGDVALMSKEALVPVVQTAPSGRKFTYSHSSLSAFDNCPAQYSGRYFYGVVPYEETDATRWGTRVHSVIENILKGNIVADPEVGKMVAPYCNAILKSPGEKFIEHQMGLTGDWTPCDFYAEEKEGSAISDVIIIHENKATCLDWKTGARRDKRGKLKTISNDQLIINFIFIALHFPHVQQFAGKYVYLGEKEAEHRTPGTETLSRKDLVPHIKWLKDRIQRVKEAWQHESWPAKTSGLCKAYCGYMECPHNGRRG